MSLKSESDPRRLCQLYPLGASNTRITGNLTFADQALARTFKARFPFLFGELRLPITASQLLSPMPSQNWESRGLIGMPFTLDAVTHWIVQRYRDQIGQRGVNRFRPPYSWGSHRNLLCSSSAEQWFNNRSSRSRTSSTRTAANLLLRHQNNAGVLLALRLPLLVNEAEVALRITVIAGHHSTSLMAGVVQECLVVLLHVEGKQSGLGHIVALCAEGPPTTRQGSSHHRASERIGLLPGLRSYRDGLLIDGVCLVNFTATPQILLDFLAMVQVVLNGRFDFRTRQLRQVTLNVGHTAPVLEVLGDMLHGDP